MSKYAVVMGDIVGSEKAPSRVEMHDRFNEVTLAANKRFAKAIASPLTITLGDEFQGLTHTHVSAFEIAATMRLDLLTAGVRCRFVVGTVELETALNKSHAWNMLGTGLAEARDKLNDKADPNAYRFSFSGPPLLVNLLETLGWSASSLEESWARTQLAYSVIAINEHPSIERIAKKFGISDTSVYKTLRTARLDLYKAQRSAILQALGEIDRGLV